MNRSRPEEYTDYWGLMVNTERFKRYLSYDPQTQCINWQGGRHRQGYGLFRARRKQDWKWVMVLPHRIIMSTVQQRALEFNEDVLHRCKNPLCCNPNHLYLKTTMTGKGNIHAVEQNTAYST